MGVMESPSQKYGYLDVKQSASVKGRKLKSWKRRWVVLTKMTDMSSEQMVAKIDLYDNETVWLTNRTQKTTFILDHVTSISKTSSRTHPHAFEVVQRHPELVFSGSSEIDSFCWILTLQQIFTPHLVEIKKSSYNVSIQQSPDANRWNLHGEYCLAVSPACLSLNHLVDGNSLISWGLSTLMRFNVTKDALTGDANVLVIECGKNGPTGESKFSFISNEASDILKAIRRSICLVLAQKQNVRRINIQTRDRSISESNSEKQFQSILDSTMAYLDVSRDRTGSESSGCTMSPITPGYPGMGLDNPLQSSPDICLGLPSRQSNSELESLNESDEDECEKRGDKCQISNQLCFDKNLISKQHSRTTSLDYKVKRDDPGYSVIKDVKDASVSILRRNTISTSDAVQGPEEVPLRPPSRTQRAVVEHTSAVRAVSFIEDDENRSDVDFPMSSSLLSSSFDSAKSQADHLLHYHKSKGAMEDLIDLETDSPPPPGYLNRRRSSSTPDLAAFWKHQASLENVYEELDSIRSSAPQKSISSPMDIPPALPARPFNLPVPTFRQNKNQTIVRFKKSFFFNKTQMKRGKSTVCIEKHQDCSCKNSNISNRGLLMTETNIDICEQCGGSTNARHYDEVDRVRRPNNDSELSSSLHSDINDIYSSISDIKEKSSTRRRSSDTSRPIYLSAENNTLNNVNINNQKARRLSAGSNKNPLISFFTDNERFASNPMVTGELARNQRLFSPPDDLLMSPDSPKQTTSKDCVTEGIFAFDSVTSSEALQINTVISNPKHFENNVINSNLFPNTFATPLDSTSLPITYTSLRPTDDPFVIPTTNPLNNGVRVDVHPLLDVTSTIITKNTPRSITSVTSPTLNNAQFPLTTGNKQTSSESLYHSMQTKTSEGLSRKLTNRYGNHSRWENSLQGCENSNIDLIKSFSVEGKHEQFYLDDDLMMINTNSTEGLTPEKDDIYVTPGN